VIFSISNFVSSVEASADWRTLPSGEFLKVFQESALLKNSAVAQLEGQVDLSIFIVSKVFVASQSFLGASGQGLRQTSRDRIARFMGYQEAVIAQQQFICCRIRDGEQVAGAELDGLLQAAMRLSCNFISIVEELRRLEGKGNLSAEVDKDFREIWPGILSRLPEGYQVYLERIAEQIGLK